MGAGNVASVEGNPMASFVGGSPLIKRCYTLPKQQDPTAVEEHIDPNESWLDRKLKALGKKLEKGCEDNGAQLAMVAGFFAGVSLLAGGIWALKLGGFTAVTLLSGPVGCGLVALVLLVVALAALARRHQVLKA